MHHNVCYFCHSEATKNVIKLSVFGQNKRAGIYLQHIPLFVASFCSTGAVAIIGRFVTTDKINYILPDDFSLHIVGRLK